MSQEIILVVDDDREIVRAIAINLEAEGFQVLKAYDGLEALDYITSADVRLIVMDVMMPHLDGLSALMKYGSGATSPLSSCPRNQRRATRSWGSPWAPTTM